jgi:nickel transport protein
VTKRFLAVLAALAVPAVAGAHEVFHSVERGRAVAVRVWESDGDPIADAPYEVYSPSAPEVAFQGGRTDRSGWLSFVPDVPGRWRVKVVGPDGHGLDVEVDAGAGAAPSTAGGAAPSSVAFVLRPLVGLAAIGAVFGGLFVFYRRKGAVR